MKTLKKILAGSFLTFGLAILLLGTLDLINSKKTSADKEGSLAALVIFGLPSTAIGTWLFWSLRQQHEKQLKEINLAKEQLFLRLLQQEKGELTVTKFALSAQISIEEAKLYLDEKAKQLNASFEISDQEGIIYRFPG
jgi:type II secretory pathway pseudopilin PulG